jgi:folate-binding protein YgfZ
MSCQSVLLPQRGVLAVGGEDRFAFLQGLISNDVRRVCETQAIYAALLTAQGKFLHDFLIVARQNQLLFDCESERLDDLQRRLRVYRLRSQVTFAPLPELAVFSLLGDGAANALGLAGAAAGTARALADGVVFVDPRLPALGMRALLPRDSAPSVLGDLGFTAANDASYERLRLLQGVPDGRRDLLVEKSVLLEGGFEELNGIDWNKGCYVGQEVTARTKYRGLTKRRLVPVRVEGALPAAGTPILAGDREVGEVRSALADRAIALLRIDALTPPQQPLTTNAGSRLIPELPEWMRLPAGEA